MNKITPEQMAILTEAQNGPVTYDDFATAMTIPSLIELGLLVETDLYNLVPTEEGWCVLDVLKHQVAV